MQLNGARKRVLLIGAAWTLAAALTPAFFKSPLFEPIYLWTLGVTALGWMAIMLHVIAAEQRAAGISLATAVGETRAVIDELAQVMSAEMRRACNELMRVDELLAHAIEQLMSAFNSVSDQASSHQNELAQAAAAASAQGTPAAERMRLAAERVAKDVNGAVTALQFRDVVGQKLGHVRRELEALEQVMDRIRAVSTAQPEQAAASERLSGPGQAQLTARIQGLLQELERTKATSPVQQELMHAGEVDLF